MQLAFQAGQATVALYVKARHAMFNLPVDIQSKLLDQLEMPIALEMTSDWEISQQKIKKNVQLNRSTANYGVWRSSEADSGVSWMLQRGGQGGQA